MTELYEQLWEAVNQLPEESQVVLTLVLADMWEGRKLNISDLARTTSIPQATFNERLGRALVQLGERLKEMPAVRDWLEQHDTDLLRRESDENFKLELLRKALSPLRAERDEESKRERIKPQTHTHRRVGGSLYQELHKSKEDKPSRTLHESFSESQQLLVTRFHLAFDESVPSEKINDFLVSLKKAVEERGGELHGSELPQEME